jgi:hypothetical protein
MLPLDILIIGGYLIHGIVPSFHPDVQSIELHQYELSLLFYNYITLYLRNPAIASLYGGLTIQQIKSADNQANPGLHDPGFA